ncbi:hypothetical protein [Halomonas sp. H2]|uniref:hypothetical protein n=1 Tax=Halomonas sp. H2 TaxID=261936 RepID=UPI003CF5B03A
MQAPQSSEGPAIVWNRHRVWQGGVSRGGGCHVVSTAWRIKPGVQVAGALAMEVEQGVRQRPS